MINWCGYTEDCLEQLEEDENSTTITDWLRDNFKFIHELTQLVRGKFEHGYQRRTVEALLITDVHNKEVLIKLLNDNA